MNLRPIELSPRLRIVAELVPGGTRFADIGTDHAYLPVWLLQRGILSHAIVADLRSGPLDRAHQTAERYGLTEQISFRLCNGLQGIAPQEVETIAIAGMGGETIAEILAAAPWVREEDRRLLLQPMSSQPELRTWLQEHGYCIVQEHLCQEGHTIYTVFDVRPGKMPPFRPGERWAGRQHPGETAPLRTAYLEKLCHQTVSVVEGLRRSVRPSDAARLAEMEAVLEDLEAMTEEWKQWQL